ncbi:MAG: hypothetical protein ACLSAP_11430 [Oscillospiraceae bacterium]
MSMEIILLAAAAAGILCALLLGVRLALYRRQVRQFRERIAFISDTNLIDDAVFTKELAALAVSINECGKHAARSFAARRARA